MAHVLGMDGMAIMVIIVLGIVGIILIIGIIHHQSLWLRVEMPDLVQAVLPVMDVLVMCLEDSVAIVVILRAMVRKALILRIPTYVILVIVVIVILIIIGVVRPTARAVVATDLAPIVTIAALAGATLPSEVVSVVAEVLVAALAVEAIVAAAVVPAVASVADDKSDK